MDITVKGVKEIKSLSEDSICFDCSVYVNGKRAFTARNRGNGGPTLFDPIRPYPKSRALIQEAEEYCKSLPEVEWEYGDGEVLKYQPDLDYVVSGLVSEYLDAQEWKRMLKGKTYFKLPEDKLGDWRYFSHPYDDQMKVYLQKQYPGQKLEIANETWKVFS